MNHEMRIESIEWLKALAVYCTCGWAHYTHSVDHVTSLYRAHLDTPGRHPYTAHTGRPDEGTA